MSATWASPPAYQTAPLTVTPLPGFVRFSCTIWMVVITARSKVGLLGGHFVFHSEGTELVEICRDKEAAAASIAEDQRHKNAFTSVYLSRNFYFRCVTVSAFLQNSADGKDLPFASQPHLRHLQHLAEQPPPRLVDPSSS